MVNVSSNMPTPPAADPLSPFRSGLIERVRWLRREGRLALAVQAEIGNWISIVGERLNAPKLVFNNWAFAMYHRGALETAPFVIEKVISLYPNLKSAVDLGSGTGVYMHELHRHGLEVVGYEYIPHARRLTKRRYGFDIKPFDINDFKGVDKRYDLSLCIEVAQYFTPGQADVLIRHMVKAAPLILFSSARPNQEAYGTVNKQPREWWVERFGRQGAHLNVDATEKLENHLNANLRRLRFLAGNMGIYDVR